jgi:hypothetical protein
LRHLSFQEHFMKTILHAALLCLCVATIARAQLREQLELFFDLGERDSIVRVEQPAPGRLRVEVLDKGTGGTRSLTAAVPANAAARLRARAEEEGVAVGTWVAAPAATPMADEDAGREEYLSSPRELRRNRLNYVLTQTAFSYYLYSIALPVAFEADPQRSAALQVLSLPVAFGTHYLIARGKDYHDAHLWSTDYFSTNSLILSYGIPYILMGSSENYFRTGSIVAAAAYPVSLWAGYRHGEQLLDDPGRVKLQSNVSTSSGLTAFLAAMALKPDHEGEAYWRLTVAGTMGAGVAGHYLSYYYRPGESVPGGVGEGILTHTLLGFVAGINLAVLAEAEDGRTATALMTLGAAAGFGEGLYYFRDKQDSYERARYSIYGMLGGAMIPTGLALLAGTEPNPKLLMTAVTASAIGGYAITRHFTSHLVESPRDVKHKGHPGFTLDLLPVPEPYARQTPEGSEIAMRLRVPGATWRF